MMIDLPEPIAAFIAAGNAVIAERDGKTVVTSRVSGSFPGSPIEFEFVFGLADGNIASLEIL